MKKFLAFFLVMFVGFLPLTAFADGSLNYSLGEEQSVIKLADEISNATHWKSHDIHLLAKVIHGEARGEDYIGKVAVAAVVLNRIKSPSFPNTLTEVVYQTNAFTCVKDGQIHLTPDIESYQAAFDAILGNDPTEGCLYYMNPTIATSRWMHKRMSSEAIKVIGNHVFFSIK